MSSQPKQLQYNQGVKQREANINSIKARNHSEFLSLSLKAACLIWAGEWDEGKLDMKRRIFLTAVSPLSGTHSDGSVASGTEL